MLSVREMGFSLVLVFRDVKSNQINRVAILFGPIPVQVWNTDPAKYTKLI